MKHVKKHILSILCLLVMVTISGCNGSVKEITKSFSYGMTESEKAKLVLEATELGDKITFFDEEINDTYEINLLKSSDHEPSNNSELYIVQGTSLHDTQLSALKAYLDACAPQTLLAIFSQERSRLLPPDAKRDFIKKADKYEAFISGNLLVWFRENYNISPKDTCYVGYETAGYFAAYMLHSENPFSKYLIVNPELQHKTDKLDIPAREEAFFNEGNHSLPANLYILWAEDDTKSLPYTKSESWISALEHNTYKDLTIRNEILAGGGHNVIDIEALLRGICYFNNTEFGNKETYYVEASKAMSQAEKDSIRLGKLSSNHINYKKVIDYDPEAAEYIKELEIYDEEIKDTFTVHFSLPPDYDETKSYPLVLMTDGIWRLSDHWRLRSLMVNGEIEKVILVSVGYPDGYDYLTLREREFLEHPDLYLQFLVNNLISYFNANYKIDTSRLTLTGHSYGGFWGLYALYHSDTIGKNTFAYYYIGSPSLQANTNLMFGDDFNKFYNNRMSSLPCSVYITVGSQEELPFIEMIKRHYEKLAQQEYEDFTIEYECMEGYGHDTVFKPSIINTMIKFYGTK